jgi:hypothetical protein
MQQQSSYPRQQQQLISHQEPQCGVDSNTQCVGGQCSINSRQQNRQQCDIDIGNSTQQSSNPHTQHLDMSLGLNTRTKKSEMSAGVLEPNHTHPNHKGKGFDPFHGETDNHTTDRRTMRNQNLTKYQMDPSRVANQMNPNAQHMFNAHNEQMKDNPYADFSASDHIEPTYYDQTQYSGLDTDRMFLAEAKDISDQQLSVGNPDFNTYMQDTNINQVMPEELVENQNEFKQKRSYRNPEAEFESNNKLWEYQFTPMTTQM